MSHPPKSFRWPVTRLDVAGAFGDIGVLFPIAIALISLNHLNPTAVFLTAGLMYVLAGAYFQIPISVQPLKAVAAIVLALQLPPSAIASAGLVMGFLLLLIGLTNLATPLVKLFSLPIIRGIQLGLGLLLAREGLRLVFGQDSGLVLFGSVPISTWGIGLAAAVILFLFRGSQRFPASLVLLATGAALGLLAHGRNLTLSGWGPLPLEILHPRVAELKSALLTLVIPQFALTIGNAVVATENTTRLLYGKQARRVTARALSLSMGLTNLASGLLLSAPTCHGSGGVTAHYKFGARTAKSSTLIGGVCLLLALLGGAAVGVLKVIPTPVLGVFLVYVGIQHAAFVRDILKQKASVAIAIVTGLVALATINLTYGFLAGFLLQGLFSAASHLRKAPLHT
jgi:SulP family sulfate permease